MRPWRAVHPRSRSQGVSPGNLVTIADGEEEESPFVPAEWLRDHADLPLATGRAICSTTRRRSFALHCLKRGLGLNLCVSCRHHACHRGLMKSDGKGVNPDLCLEPCGTFCIPRDLLVIKHIVVGPWWQDCG